MSRKKEMNNIRNQMKKILSRMTDKQREGFNTLYRMCKSEGYSDEKFYKELIEFIEHGVEK